MERQMEQMRKGKKDDFIAVLLLAGFAFWVNRGIEIKGLYMDDLYLWSCYGEQSFFQFIFPIGSSRFRFLYYLAAWLELALTGSHVEWFVPINILLNVGIGFTIYRMARKFSRCAYVGILCGIAYLASRMAYYQIGQVYGLMESMALWMALAILYLLCDCLNEWDGVQNGKFWIACLLYVGICFVHERYMVLVPLFFLIPLRQKSRDWKLWLAPAGSFALVQAIRFWTIGRLSVAGTGGTDVADTFSPGIAFRFALSQLAYLLGINAGPEHLNGQNFRQAPLWVLLLIGAADMMLLVMIVAWVSCWLRGGKKTRPELWIPLLFFGFIGGCIVCSSVTIRVEMRWIYVSYSATLLWLSWMYGAMTDQTVDGQTGKERAQALCLAAITAYTVWMVPVELYYRSLYPNLYYWPNQQRYNQLAEETYGTYGDGIFGKTIYIVGNHYEISNFTAETFFKVFDRERKAAGTQVVHIQDIRDIGLVTEQMLVLAEEPQHNRYQDITQAVREIKCRSLYGYYDDGWMDERAEVWIMAGETGKIKMDFDYPRELSDNQQLTVYVNEEPQIHLKFDRNQMQASVLVKPYETVRLRFESSFHVPDALEQRGEWRLAAKLTLTAD